MQTKNKILFIDRDGTLIKEPPVDFQVDSLEKLEFYPGVFTHLGKIASCLDFKLVMVTNQDGLGTPLFPEETFWPAHLKMMTALENEDIRFDAVHIDPSLPEEKSPNRKPGIGMLTSYLGAEYDLASSWVIGDRMTDVELAKNLGCKAILLSDPTMGKELITQADLTEYCSLITNSWEDISAFLFKTDRSASIIRSTSETNINITLNLDGKGESQIHTGLHFFDHMLHQIARHSGCDLSIEVKGDLEVDEHHTIEDTALALGEAFRKALGDKRGVERYGFCLPMDDCLAMAALDFGGRPWLVWEADFKREMVGDMPTEMVMHFFKSFSDAARCNLHLKVDGQNEHHKIEGLFKALAKAIKMAIRKDVFNNELPSTKGVL